MKAILVLSLGLIASPLFAQTIIPSCSGHRVTVPLVHQQAYTHGHNQQYVQKVVTTDVHATPIFVAVPVDSVAVPVQAFRANYYYSVGEGYAQKAMLREVVAEELRKLIPAGGGAPVTLPNPAGMSPKTNPITNPSTNPKGKVVADDVTPLELQAKVLAAFNSDKGRCVSCHGPTKQSAGLQLITEDGKLVKFNRMMRLGINNAITSGFMPQEAQTDGSKAVDSKYYGDLLQWAIQKD